MADWHESVREAWDRLFRVWDARRCLEIGSYEGDSARHLIEILGARHSLELCCVDSWEGSTEHAGVDMAEIHATFQRTIDAAASSAAYDVSVDVRKGFSVVELPKLLVELGGGYFDFVYVDGSHAAADVLFDAVVGFRLLRPGGVMALDDYLWGDPARLLDAPKLAIDAFVNCHLGRLRVLPAPQTQIYVQKVGD